MSSNSSSALDSAQVRPADISYRRRNVPRLYIDLPRKKTSSTPGAEISTASSTTFPVSPSPTSACCSSSLDELACSLRSSAMSASILIGIRQIITSPCSPRQRLSKLIHSPHLSMSPDLVTSPGTPFTPSRFAAGSRRVLPAASDTYFPPFEPQTNATINPTDTLQDPEIVTVQVGPLPPVWLFDTDQELRVEVRSRLERRTIYAVSSKYCKNTFGRHHRAEPPSLDLIRLAESFAEGTIERLQPQGPYTFMGGRGLSGVFARELGAVLTKRWERSLENGQMAQKGWSVHVCLLDTVNPTMEESLIETVQTEISPGYRIVNQYTPSPFRFGPPAEIVKKQTGCFSASDSHQPLIRAKVDLFLSENENNSLDHLNGWADKCVAPNLSVTIGPSFTTPGSPFPSRVHLVADWIASKVVAA